jgi:predicted transcriptional regulator
MHQPVEQPDVETTKLQHVLKDVHLHLNHVIAKLLQFQNVEMDQPAVQLHVETTKLLDVT